ncbi:2-hydroxyisoflavanone dehydratase-like [Nicotiana tomentosiformis]|uniref:2-hydroxyisoflavanone dehydratase-like n=1 Tax=Nicotiana tomentosiformis TaxID=4098 RepID=UPI00051C26A7|nr:2-hydroxyisoflavanone dehydratase-like [Nicotiana tomentosiformis]
MDFDGNEVVIDLSPVIRVYKDGHVERLFGSPYVPPSPEDSVTGVSSKDLTISSDLKARIYHPKLSITTSNNQKLPILVYYHGGGFCVGSTFSFLSQRYLNLLVSEANIVTVSVQYSLAPEHPLSVIYDDSWTALQWVTAHVLENPGIKKEPWLIDHGDFKKIFVGGDSAGGNIAHNVVLRAGVEGLNGGVKILGGILSFPYFLSSTENRGDSLLSKIWVFVNPSAENGIDDPKINPFVEKAPSLTELGCSRLLVCVAEKDELRNLGIRYAEVVKKCGWKGEVEVVEVEGEGHCFQILNPDGEKAKHLIKRIAEFIKQ